MYAKVVDNKVVYPPYHDGNKMNVYLDPVWLAQHGYRDMTPQEIAQYDPPEEPVKIFTKLSIRRAMRSLGIQPKLDTLLNASPTFKADWTDAQVIDLDDPVLLEALRSGGITQQQLDDIIKAITLQSI